MPKWLDWFECSFCQIAEFVTGLKYNYLSKNKTETSQKETTRSNVPKTLKTSNDRVLKIQ